MSLYYCYDMILSYEIINLSVVVLYRENNYGFIFVSFCDRIYRRV